MLFEGWRPATLALVLLASSQPLLAQQAEGDDADGLPLEPARWARFTTNEGTWLSLDVNSAGDAIVFTEALTHGSMINTSNRPRRTLYYCYSIGYMPDWGGQGLHFSERINEGLTAQQQDIIRLK